MTFGKETKDHLNRKIAGLHALGQNIGKNLESTAKANAPWRDRTSNTRRAIHGGAEQDGKGTVVYLAHGSKVGWYMEEGTGIYGPKRKPITPKNANFLRFTIGGREIFVKSTKGMPKQPIIKPTVDNEWRNIKVAVRRYWEGT